MCLQKSAFCDHRRSANPVDPAAPNTSFKAGHYTSLGPSFELIGVVDIYWDTLCKSEATTLQLPKTLDPLGGCPNYFPQVWTLPVLLLLHLLQRLHIAIQEG